VAHKTGTTAHNYNDAGIIYLGDEPAFILRVYTDGVPDELPNGDAGQAAAHDLIGYLCRLCYDALKTA
jgi:hypothetical protein